MLSRRSQAALRAAFSPDDIIPHEKVDMPRQYVRQSRDVCGQLFDRGQHVALWSRPAIFTSKDLQCRRNPAHIRAVPGWSILARHTVKSTRRKTRGTGQRPQSGPAFLIANGTSAKHGAARMDGAPGSLRRNLCVRCARNIQSSWPPSRTMLSRTMVIMACSGSVNCSRCANPATTSRNSGPNGAQAGGIKSPQPERRGPAAAIRFLRVKV